MQAMFWLNILYSHVIGEENASGDLIQVLSSHLVVTGASTWWLGERLGDKRDLLNISVGLHIQNDMYPSYFASYLNKCRLEQETFRSMIRFALAALLFVFRKFRTER